MTSFEVIKHTREQNDTAFFGALIKILLHFGFPHIIVLNNDNKFKGTFAETLKLLNINIHILSGGNHNAMIVEPINQFLTMRLFLVLLVI